MGIFDCVKFETKCPKCGTVVDGFQTKDTDASLKTVEVWQLGDGARFYDACQKCNTWIEYEVLHRICRTKPPEEEA